MIKNAGSEFWTQLDMTLAKNEVGVDVCRIVLQDITRRKQAEEQLRAFALTDELTGLSNRRSFYLLAEQQIKLAIRLQQGFVLFVADTDGLKSINDNLGHQAGDKAITAIAENLRSTLRDADIVARTGGDEFAGMLIGADMQNAVKLLERLREKLAARSQAELKSFVLSISVGMAEFDPQRPAPLENLLALADERMYAEKKRKRSGSQSGPENVLLTHVGYVGEGLGGIR